VHLFCEPSKEARLGRLRWLGRITLEYAPHTLKDVSQNRVRVTIESTLTVLSCPRVRRGRWRSLECLFQFRKLIRYRF
jgi:hypothetical protein